MRRPELSGGPLALVGRVAVDTRKTGEAMIVHACSPEAQAAGLSPGTPAHMIPQRCPGAAILPFDSRYYTRCYEGLLEALDALSPEIEPQPLEVFYLDLAKLPHLRAEEPEQVGEAMRAVIPPPFAFRVGIASGKFIAWVAANAASSLRPRLVYPEESREFLENVPSMLLPVDPGMLRRLDLLGLRTLGRIARLPRSSMLAQFGRQGERAHCLACGEDREPLVPYRPQPSIRETIAFPGGEPTVAHFHLALSEGLKRACGRAECRNRGVRQVRLEAAMEAGDIWERTVTLRKPTERWELIFEELKRRLELARPEGLITELTVELTGLTARLDGQPLLFPDERQHRKERLDYELGQLRERLGRMPVSRIVEVEPWSRLPEKQYALLSCDI